MHPWSRRLLMGTLPVLLALSCVAPPTELTVLSYNIHHGRGADGVIDLERIAAVIEDSGADVVALQEVDVRTTRANGVDQAAELGRLTGMHAFFGKAIPYAGGSYGDALLSRYPMRQTSSLLLPAAPNHEIRVAVRGIVQLPGGREVAIIGTHLDHTKDPSDREAQARALNEAFLPAPLPTLLIGDLNAQPGSTPMRDLLGHGWTAADGALRPTFPSDVPEHKIDWILKAPGHGGRLHTAEVLHAPVASDHAPLRAIWIL
jgi:endonuclease/exonuclease/phosphatase family metal-dependent hydrolase